MDDFLNGYPRFITSPMKGVNWYNYDNGWGAFWFARTTWDSTRYEERFRPDEFGGSVETAMEAACAWLLQTNKALGKPTTEGEVNARMVRDDVGLARELDGHTWYWCATINDNGRQLRTRFSCAKYGEHEAYRLAWAWRREQERRIFGVTLIGGEQSESYPLPLTRRARRGQPPKPAAPAAYQPKTTRLNPARPLRPTDDELGLLPDADFFL